MTTDVHVKPVGPTMAPRKGGRRREAIYRHTFLMRLTHWVHAPAISVLIDSELNIFNVLRGDQDENSATIRMRMDRVAVT